MNLNAPSMFRKGGLAVLTPNHLTVGKEDDGSWYVMITGKESAKALLTPRQAYDMARGVLNAMGFQVYGNWDN
jgi:hypothetical protein